MGISHAVCLGAWGVLALAFANGPLLTWRQRWVARRARQRNVLLGIELGLIAAWGTSAIAGWRPRLAPEPWEAWLEPLGSALTAGGVGLAAWAKWRLGRWFSATFGVKEGHVLVTDGPYAVARHPIYAGVLAAVTGSALTWNSVPLLLLAAGLSVTLHRHTLHEEALFERHFGDAYRQYRRRVPRLVPFWRRSAR